MSLLSKEKKAQLALEKINLIEVDSDDIRENKFASELETFNEYKDAYNLA